MNSHYFAQYLLNEEKISVEEATLILSKLTDYEPIPPIMAFDHRFIEERSKNDTRRRSLEKFGSQAVKKGFITANQEKRLLNDDNDATFYFMQGLLDEGIMDFTDICAAYDIYINVEEHPIFTAMKMSLGGEAEGLDEYALYLELFTAGIINYLSTPIILEPRMALLSNVSKMHVVSLGMSGKSNFVTGLMALEPDFVELARRYSMEEIEIIDEMAIDSLKEFFNVINGLYTVELAARDIEMELGLPRYTRGIMPMGEGQQIFRMYTDFGSFYIVLSRGEFF